MKHETGMPYELYKLSNEEIAGLYHDFVHLKLENETYKLRLNERRFSYFCAGILTGFLFALVLAIT